MHRPVRFGIICDCYTAFQHRKLDKCIKKFGFLLFERMGDETASRLTRQFTEQAHHPMHMILILALPISYFSSITASPLPVNRFNARQTAVNESDFTSIVVFGDSLSDNGNGSYQLTNGNRPGPSYFRGRWADGPVWVEYVSEYVGLAHKPGGLLNFAYGGATTDNAVQNATDDLANGTTVVVPDGFMQIGRWMTNETQPSFNDTLFILWLGTNNYLVAASSANPASALRSSPIVESIGDLIKNLTSQGVKWLLVPNLPPVEKSPYAIESNAIVQNLAGQVVDRHNEGLDEIVKGYNSSSIRILNVHALVTQVLDTPTEYGFVNVTNACLQVNQSVCARPDTYFYFDDVHPTTKSHRVLADQVMEDMRSWSWINS